MPQTSESWHVLVSNSRGLQAGRQILGLNCGLWRERGTVRTSINRRIPRAFKISMNSSIGRVECPIVLTAKEGGALSAKLPLFGDGFLR